MRVSPAVEVDTGPRTDGVPHVVTRVLVTAAFDEHQWAEWRYWVGRTVADAGPGGGVQLPPSLRDQRDRALADIAKRVDDTSFKIREGIVTHDTGVMDSFAALRVEPALGERDRLTTDPAREHERLRGGHGAIERARLRDRVRGATHDVAAEIQREQEARGQRVGLVMLAVLVTSLIAGITGAIVVGVKLGWIPRP